MAAGQARNVLIDPSARSAEVPHGMRPNRTALTLVALAVLLATAAASPALAYDPDATFAAGTWIAGALVGGGTDLQLKGFEPSDVSFVNLLPRVSLLPCQPFGRDWWKGALELGLEGWLQYYVQPKANYALGLKVAGRYHFIGLGADTSTITTPEVEDRRNALLDGFTRATCNRYRDGVSGLYTWAIRRGLAARNPIQGISKFKEPQGRVLYLTDDEEAAIRESVAPALRPHFAVSIHTGLRYTEQMSLRWQHVDLLANVVHVPKTKNGESRQVPLNRVARAVLLDLAARRVDPDDPRVFVFSPRPEDSSPWFGKAVERAQGRLRDAGQDASRLEGYTWHGNRHTFASRLVMAGVDLRTVQVLGGWKTFKMVERYAHLSPGHLHAAVERLAPERVPGAAIEGAVGPTGAVELSRFYPGAPASREESVLDAS
jgi:integrase